MAPRSRRLRRAALVLGVGVLAARLASAADVITAPGLLDALQRQQWDVVDTALRQGVSVKSVAPDGSTPLHWAVHFDRGDLAQRLLKAGADANAATDLGVTPLGLACENGSSSMVQLLLQSGAQTTPPTAAVPPLLTAARVGNVDVVRALLAKGANPNGREPQRQQTALMWAAANAHPDVVDVLLRAGAAVDARTRTKGVVVQRASRYSGVVSREEGLASRGVIEIPTGGSTALLFAARVGDAASARLLLAAGAKVNDISPDGTTALVIAVHSGQREVASLLLEKGAAVNAAGSGYTALHAAVLRGDAALVSQLLDHGADREATVTQGTPSRRYSRDYAFNEAWIGATPLWLAARFAEIGILRELLQKGANVHATTKDRTNAMTAVITAGVEFGPSASDRRERRLDPLDITALADNRTAFEKEALDVVRVLADAGVDVNVVNAAGDSALHQAAAKGYPTIVQFLAERGARLEVKNARGATPLAMTVSRRGGDENAWVKKAGDILRSLGAQE